MSSFSSNVSANAIGFGVVWTGVLLFQHLSAQVSQKILPKDEGKPIPQADEPANRKAVTINERWYYPPDIADDLKDVNLPSRVKEEVLACAWEYTRCVVPEYTNWKRYVAFMRIIVIGTIAEFRGSLMDVANDDNMVGYKLSEVLKALCGGTAGEDVFSTTHSRPTESLR